MTIVIKRNKWEIWRDVIFALFAREIRTGFNDKFGLSWAVLNPVAFIFILSFLRGRLDGGETHTIPTFTFMAIGILFIQSFIQTLGKSARTIKQNKPLYAFRQVQPLSAVIAGGFFQILIKAFVIIGIIIIMYFLGIDLQISDPLLFISCYFLLILLAMGIGLVFGIAELFVQEFSKIREMMTRPLFFISGVFFSLQDIPKEYWHYLNWNPILHAIELTRYSVYSTYGHQGVSVGYLAWCVLIFTFLSLALYHTLWKQAISQ
ncbi:ABC transporter permease [Paraglaciecola marina]|uniref:ABC transporter permease n=1 Tax=Paraglaciecola marina TaxID=2500157 RepID=UPI0010613CE0|nr:ABC transporter permease [Paraglaciecola marina]